MSVIVGNYGKYSSKNYGSSRYVKIGKLTLYFSYETVVAFQDGGDFFCRENDWSTTTGKHLNWLVPDKEERILSECFEKMLELTLIKYNLN
jgi:hypothetical protein